MPQRKPSGLRLDRLRYELSQNPEDVAARRAAAVAIGRILLDERLRTALRAAAVEHHDLVLSPVLPVINHFPKLWMADLATNGKSSETLKLRPGYVVPERLYGTNDFMIALENLVGLDTTSAFSTLRLPLLGVVAERRTGWNYGVAIRVGDIVNHAYPSGFSVQGEKDVLGPIKQRSYSPVVLTPPAHKIHIADASSPKYGRQDIADTFVEAFSEMGLLDGQTELEFSGIKPVLEDL